MSVSNRLTLYAESGRMLALAELLLLSLAGMFCSLPYRIWWPCGIFSYRFLNNFPSFDLVHAIATDAIDILELWISSWRNQSVWSDLYSFHHQGLLLQLYFNFFDTLPSFGVIHQDIWNAEHCLCNCQTRKYIHSSILVPQALTVELNICNWQSLKYTKLSIGSSNNQVLSSCHVFSLLSSWKWKYKKLHWDVEVAEL